MSLGGRLAALLANRTEISSELGRLEEGTVRERLQTALGAKAERERALSDARAGLEHLTDALRSHEDGRLAAEQALDPLRERITELRLKAQEAATHAEQYAQQIEEAGVTRED